MPTLVPSPEPEQAAGTAVSELPDVDSPAACGQFTSAPGRPLDPSLGPQGKSATMTNVSPTPHLDTFKNIFVYFIYAYNGTVFFSYYSVTYSLFYRKCNDCNEILLNINLIYIL